MAELALPTVPAGAIRSRCTVVALAAGAAVAAAQSAADQVILGPESPAVAPLAATGLSPAVETADEPARGFAPTPTTVTGDDLADLAKAVALGQEATRRSSLLDQARAAGAPVAALSGDEVVVQPVTGRMTSGAGPRWGSTHYGLDIANGIGTPIFAVTDGIVERSGPASGFGLWVVLRHPDGTRSVYGHINSTSVQTGDRVRAGERIAEVGNRGQSTGPHLHLEIWDGAGGKIDPTGWLKEHGLEVQP